MKKGTCKFHNGDFHNTHCKAGVLYRDVTSEPDRIEGRALRKPCIQWDKWKSLRGEPLTPRQEEEFNKRGCCHKYEDPTNEEIRAHELEMNAHVERLMKTLPLIGKIKKAHKGKNWSGVEQCPICSGNLHMTHAAFNCHVWGQCETKDCVNWME